MIAQYFNINSSALYSRGFPHLIFIIYILIYYHFPAVLVKKVSFSFPLLSRPFINLKICPPYILANPLVGDPRMSLSGVQFFRSAAQIPARLPSNVFIKGRRRGPSLFYPYASGILTVRFLIAASRSVANIPEYRYPGPSFLQRPSAIFGQPQTCTPLAYLFASRQGRRWTRLRPIAQTVFGELAESSTPHWPKNPVNPV